MKTPFTIVLVVLLRGSLIAQVSEASEWRPLVLNHVTVINVVAGQPLHDRTVVIQGNHITAIGPSSKIQKPENALVVNATGKFLIPGLWDMHVHIGDEVFDRNSYLPLFIAEGITGIRIMDGLPEHHQWRKEIGAGTLLGPRMVIASRMIGFGDLSNISETRAREEVRKAKREGADFIKVHDYISRTSYFALINESRRLNLSVQGHVPTSITAIEASNSGQKSIEHLTGMDEAKSDNKKAAELIAVFRRNHTWQCPTTNMRQNYAILDNAHLADDRRLEYVKPSSKLQWLSMTKSALNTAPGEWSKRRETIRKEKALINKMQKAGIGILAGTDDGNPYSFVGFSIHDELAIMVEAGLTPTEALRTATLNPAKFFNKLPTQGTVENGKLADLVLLDANPLRNIRNTQRINAVVVNGRFLTKAQLQQILAKVRAAAANGN